MGLNGIGQVDGTRTGMCSTGQNGKCRDVTGVDEGGRESWGRNGSGLDDTGDRTDQDEMR